MSSSRPRRLVWTALTWAGAVAFPCMLLPALQGAGGRSGPQFLTGAAGPYGARLFIETGDSGPSGVRLLLPFLLMVLPVVLLRRRPWPSTVLLVLGWVAVIAAGPSWESGYLKIVADDVSVALLVATQRRRNVIVGVAVAALTQLVCAVFYAGGPDSVVRTAAFIVLGLVAAFTTGNSVRQRRRHADELRTQAAQQAVTAERLRIARELHDMVAHSIGIIAIQAGVGSRVIGTQPGEARSALDAIEATSRETLSGLRRMLGALRKAEPETVPLDAAPGLDDVERLAEATMDAGVRVDVRWVGERRTLPAEIELSAFRIVQEALTNVVRHAGVADCRVTIEQRDGELVIEVLDEGRGGVVGTGYGIVGMRERVGLLRGTFSAGPRVEGPGFRVEARLPVPARDRE